MKLFLPFFVFFALSFFNTPAASAAPHSKRPSAPAASPASLQSLSKAALEEKSATRLRALEQFADRNSARSEGALAELALGYYWYQQNKLAAAKPYFEAARAVATPVQDYADFFLALTLAGLGEKEAAVPLLEEILQRFADSPLAPKALLQLAGLQIDLQRAKQAAAMLESSPLRLPEPEATMLLARAYRAAGDLLKAVAAYRRVYYFSPTSYFAPEAERQLEAIAREMGSDFPPTSLEMHQARADKLYDAGEWRDAMAEYAAVISRATGAARERAEVRAAACRLQNGQNWPALTALQKLAPTDPDVDAERLYYMALGYRRVDRPQAMEEQVNLIGQRQPASEWYQKAALLAGNYYLTQNDNQRAAAYYARLSDGFPASDASALAQWKIAWFAYRERRWEDARRLFEEHIQRFPSSPQISAALYWLGRVVERESPASAAPYYQKLVEVFPNYYYAMLARERLEELPPIRNASMAAASSEPALLSGIQRSTKASFAFQAAAFPSDAGARAKRIHERAELLESAWLIDLAIDELRYVTSDNQLSAWAGAEMARLEGARGRFHVSLRYAKRYIPGYLAFTLDDLPRPLWEALFPLPWWEQIKKQASAAHVDPYLVAGLIRQESEFDPQARSRSNARGLMQLLPSTARSMARKVADRRARRYTLANLYVPDINLVYGTFYLKKVLDQFDGTPEYALAGYNAGENRVVQWLRDGSFEDAAEFVESIPYTETRDYVQAVLRNAALYRQLYSGRK